MVLYSQRTLELYLLAVSRCSANYRDDTNGRHLFRFFSISSSSSIQPGQRAPGGRANLRRITD